MSFSSFGLEYFSRYEENTIIGGVYIFLHLGPHHFLIKSELEKAFNFAGPFDLNIYFFKPELE